MQMLILKYWCCFVYLLERGLREKLSVLCLLVRFSMTFSSENLLAAYHSRYGEKGFPTHPGCFTY